MKKKMVEVTLNGSGQTLVLHFNREELGLSCDWLDKWGKIQLEAVSNLSNVNFLAVSPIAEGKAVVKEAKFIYSWQIGNFKNHLKADTNQIFELELIEMDEKEIAALPEFEGW